MGEQKDVLTSTLSLEERVRRLVRPNLHVIKPYVPGRPIADVQREFGLHDVVKLASNENPLGPSPKALDAISDLLLELNRYPDGAAQDVRTAIAQHVHLQPEQVFVGNGSDEIIKMIAETFLQPGDEVIVPFPSFAQYNFGAQVMEAKIIPVPLTKHFQYDFLAMQNQITDKTKLIYVCSPNNPTGTWVTHTQVKEFLESIPDGIIVVLDEAYLEYVDTPDPLRSLEFVTEGKTVLSLRTFSKMYGLAGLRLGYALGDAGLIKYLHQVREPFNVNAVAQVGATAALQDTEHVNQCKVANHEGRLQYYEGLTQLGLEYIETQGNFLLAKVGNGVHVFQELERHGVIVRAGFPGLDEYIRISIGTEEENRRCLQALEQALKEM
ncbi:MAG: histidinol-phosphate transaminase [Acidibacillus sp.]|nr:histidinol-phosphate transaminase [Acidibacillus sp.]